jgi:hypothetical protein
VFARFSIADRAILPLVREYVSAWTRANRTWTRIWRSNVITVEQMDFNSEFLSEPRLKVEPGDTSFSVVLEGRSSATRWKDWAVFLVDDISKVFPEVSFDRFKS